MCTFYCIVKSRICVIDVSSVQSETRWRCHHHTEDRCPVALEWKWSLVNNTCTVSPSEEWMRCRRPSRPVEVSLFLGLPRCRTTQPLAEEDADKETGGGETRASQPSLSAIVKTRSLFDFVRTDSRLHGKQAASCEIGLWGGLAPRPCYHREDHVYQVRAAQSQPTLQFNIVRDDLEAVVMTSMQGGVLQGTVEG